MSLKQWLTGENQQRLTYAEQALLSGTTFLALLFFARTLEKAEWGMFSISLALFHFLQGFQRATITIPLITFSPTTEAIKLDLKYWFGTMHRFAAVTVIGVVVLLGLMTFLNQDHWLTRSLLGLLILTVPQLYYEFFRRVLIQLGRYSWLFALACIGTLFTVGAMAASLLLSSNGNLAAAIYASGATVASLTAIWLLRHEIASSSSTFKPPSYANAPSFTKWALLSHLAFSAYVIGTPLVLALISGPAAVAVLTATRNLVQPLNTLLTAIDSIDKPRASRAWTLSGVTGLQRSLGATRRKLLIVGGSYLSIIVFAGDSILHHLYNGRYDDNTQVYMLWAAVYMFMLLSQPSETGLYVIRRPDLLFRARSYASILGLTTAVATIPALGVIGAAIALAVGWGVSALLTHTMLTKSNYFISGES